MPEPLLQATSRDQRGPTRARPAPRGIQFRGPLQWRYQVRAEGFTRTGVRSTEADAAQARTEVIRHIQMGDLLEWEAACEAYAVGQKMTLRAALKRYLSEIVPKKDSERDRVELQNNAARTVADLEALHMADKPLAGVRKADMIALRDRCLDAGLSASTTAKRMYLVSAVFRTADDNWGLEVANPCRGRDAQGHRVVPNESVGRDRSKARRLTKDELRSLFAAAQSVQELPEILAVGCATGLRLGQVVALNRNWIDFKAAEITFPNRSEPGRPTRSKNARGQKVPLSPFAVALLQDLPTKPNGQYFSRSVVTVSVAMNRIRSRLELPPMSFHTIRHHYNSLLLDQGLGPEERAVVLGQLTAEVNSKHYTHVDRDRLARALVQLPSPASTSKPRRNLKSRPNVQKDI